MTAQALVWRWPERRFPSRTVLTGVLTVGVGWAISATTLGGLNQQGLSALWEILAAASRPELDPAFLITAMGDAAVTVSYALAGMMVATAIGIPAAIVASGSLLLPGPLRVLSAGTMRAGLGGLRAIHELVWALLFVNAFGLSPWAGVLAIGLPYGGIVGRNLAEHLIEVPQGPLKALTSAGARRWQEVLWGRIPMAAADGVGYLVYRFECAVRSAAILSFVGLGGLGYRINLALHDLLFEQVWTLVYMLIGLIVVIDTFGRRLRGKVRG